MSLAKIEIPVDYSQPLPLRVATLLADATASIEAFAEKHIDDPAAGFVPSNYEMVYRGLRALRQAAGGGALPGNAFCEWGCGLGIVATLASELGFDAVGIEIDGRLVEAGKEFARNHRVNVELVQGSYVPNGHEPVMKEEEVHVMTLENGRAAYEDLGLGPEDFDCIFVYPWPGEDEIATCIFDRYAARGAVLLTFHGVDGLLARRKIR